MTDGPDRPSRHGAILGEALSKVAKAGDDGIMELACSTCAFKEGTVPNQTAGTGSLALNCVLGIDDAGFACHHGMKEDWPTKLCAGYVAAQNASWEVTKALIADVAPRLAAMEGPDQVRADYDAWLVLHDPDEKMDVYEIARLYAKTFKGETNAVS